MSADGESEVTLTAAILLHIVSRTLSGQLGRGASRGVFSGFSDAVHSRHYRLEIASIIVSTGNVTLLG